MPSVRLGRHEAKDGDVLMHACQKITAQLFSARSHTDMADDDGGIRKSTVEQELKV
ncbi:Hypothetical protein SMAX5B_019191 [Scophthalmus maximus]|uniref:Uncharacterized protein n=1 Tax=Scophthalmus maximus TaxID=52904 RepID=A0A2U9C6X0_SCOMX|nr:Hypothetical protein SMAX5B_019191 [Scophthalmus maximus]